MKLLIVSDSHGNRSALENLKVKYEGMVDAMIHCGDSELKADDPALNGFAVVGGNCDLDSRLPEELVLKIKESTIFIAHGHLLQIKSSLMNISYRAKELGADCVFFGHSHLLGAEMIDGKLFLNPGSILLPRGGNEKTYAIVNKKDSVFNVHFYNDRHEELKQYRRTFE
ncbi:metallophosphoesterase [Lederbergia citrea]|uniref:Phosphoesterase n=1 Tax=Lederbergia citrea TaxID=2833581 RepID=A0A942UTF5_9BACI|nr:metallophosphoesterase [Lederbergia citrea]